MNIAPLATAFFHIFNVILLISVLLGIAVIIKHR